MTNKTKQRKQVVRRRKQTPFADAGQIAGNALGTMFNQPWMKGVGRWLGSGIGAIFGSGDYTMVGQTPQYNVLTNGAQVPQFKTGNKTNVICHREYLGDINGSTVFTNHRYRLNPGDPKTFPWLSTIAAQYQQYRFHGIIFEFRPLITDFVTSGAPGVVVFATNYNADAPKYTSKIQMENSEYAVSVKPTTGLIHGVECAPGETPVKQLYVRTGKVPEGQDLRLYDLGQTQFATQQNPNQILGELWVSYCVEFFKPQLNDDIASHVQSYRETRGSPTSFSPFGNAIITPAVGDLTVDFKPYGGVDVGCFLDPDEVVPGQVYLMEFNYISSADVYTWGTLNYQNMSPGQIRLSPNSASATSGFVQMYLRADQGPRKDAYGVTFPGCTLPAAAAIYVTVSEVSGVVF